MIPAMRALLLVPAVAVLGAPAFAGTIKGTVIYEGQGPERTEVVRDTDPYCAKTKQLSDDVIVTKGKLKDVLVRVKNGTMGKTTAPTTPIVLDQKGCQYIPHVVGMQPGQKLVVKNSDGTFHNVNGQIAGKPLFNKPHQPNGPDLTFETTAQAGDVIDIVCNVHAWMHAYAVVQDHPYFAVTGEDGTFTIDGLKPGTYELEAWHPTLGTKTLKVTVGVGAKATVPARIGYKP
jgi:plastocyanin